ncbi:hypothetical protein F4777DRAFT_408422 [Nemania sp. FL0916]|nr:hypothetical protein F4777DRAFT_408422 [Nemania sp. FL0916]
MADIYTPPPDGSYLLNHPFYMPTDTGTIWAIAFSNSNATLITAGLSVVISIIFILLWNLVCFAALLFPGNTTRRRYVALVAIWNSNDAWFAARQMTSYAYYYFRDSTYDFAYGLVFAIIAIVVYGGSLALGIVGPSLVQVGNVAPVRPSTLYYPRTSPEDDPVGILKEFGLKAPGVLRALGSVEAAGVTTRDRVNIRRNVDDGTSNNSEPIHQITYNYQVTGVDFGLQQGSELQLRVEGACTTEYGWMNKSQTGEWWDGYQLWGLETTDTIFIFFDEPNILNAPKAYFLLHPNADDQYRKTGNRTFAVVVESAHRASISEGSDPWYATELRNNSYGPAPFEAKFWMKRGRPVLSCWQKDTWSYGAHTAVSVFNLTDIPGIKVSKTLLGVLQTALQYPTWYYLGASGVDSALRSRTTTPNGAIDASASSILLDLERLLVAGFVATRNIFLDTTMFNHDTSLDNIMQAENGQPADGAGDFVVATTDIQTFSLTGIIVVAVILVSLLVTESLISLTIGLHQRPARGGPSDAQSGSGDEQQTKDSSASRIRDRWILFKALSAVQLFRRIYQTGMGHPDNDWSCDSHFPIPDDGTPFRLMECPGNNNKGLTWCKGHIKGHVPPLEDKSSQAK